MSILLILLILIAVYLGIAFGIGRYLSREFVYSKSKSLEHTLEKCIENEDFTREDFEAYELQPFSIESEFGYTLRGVYRPGSDPRKTVVFVHGHTWSWHGQVKYFPLYIDRGYNIIAYNHRYHGDSGGPNCTAGFFEKQDLLNIARWARKQFPQTEIFGVMGESLGAATSLQYMPLDQGLSFAHVDCPYDDMMELCDYQMQLRNIPRFFRIPASLMCRIYLKLNAGFDAKQVSPREAIMKTDTPLLIIHGDEDTYVPTRMSVEMYNRRKDTAATELFLMPGAEHAQSIKTDGEEYRKQVYSFLDRIEGSQTTV